MFNIYRSLVLLALLLPFGLVWSQADCNLFYGYEDPDFWTRLAKSPQIAGTNTTIGSLGEVLVTNSGVRFEGAGGSEEKRVHRSLGHILSNNWEMSLRFSPEVPSLGLSQGAGHYILAVTAGRQNPKQNVSDVVASQYPSYPESDQDGLLVEYLSPLYGAHTSYYFRLRAKDGTTAVVSGNIPAPAGATYYLRLKRNSSSQAVLEVFSDPGFQNHVSGSPKTLSISSGISGLHTIQHAAMPQASKGRRLWATVDDFCLKEAEAPCQSCGLSSVNLNDNENKIITEVIRTPIQTEAEIGGLIGREKHTSIHYFDQLGRIEQQISLQATPDCQDLVQVYQYDAAGRQERQYLPYAISSNGSGGKRNNPLSEQAAFYSQMNFPDVAGSDLAVPYGETVFEASPINRVLEQGAPGQDWQLGNHTISSRYHLNENGNPTQAIRSVRRWVYNPNTEAFCIGTYADHELLLTEVSNENGHRSLVFSDKAGRTVLERREVDGASSDTDPATWANTYYLYDHKGLIRHIIQPEGVNVLRSSNWNLQTPGILENQSFSYVYDGRHRVVEKRVPGADWIYMIYDSRDNLILTQDGNQRPTNQWSFLKYDPQERPIISGFFTPPVQKPREAMQAELDIFWASGTYELFEVRAADDNNNDANSGFMGYSRNRAYPGMHWANVIPHSITYYDDYDFDRDGTPDFTYQDNPEHFPNNQASERVRGMVTGGYTWILNPEVGMPNYLTTISFYDEYGRVIQTRAQNHAGGWEIEDNAYNFAGELLKSKYQHEYGQAGANPYERSISIWKYYTYDDQGRLRLTEQKV
ncbi:MAG: DUF6443 domain-containing protein, partial [Bacteroidota bacterium]